MIDGLELQPSMIDDCFELYFRDYHPQIPVIDASLTANYVYSRSQLLFWTIIAIGSRRYPKHPTLISSLAPRVMHLALSSLNARSQPIQAIKGLMLLLTYPFSSNSFIRDPTFVLSGSLLHMAMQCGLHAPIFSNDFSRINTKLTEQEVLRRAEIWAYVVITYQRSCSGSGHAALASLDVYNEQEQFKSLLQKLPPSLRVQLRLNGIIERAHKALLEVGLLTMTLQQERTMDSLLRVFESEISGAEASLIDPNRYRDGLFGNGQAPSSNQWDRLYVSIARQDIAAMHFYKTETFDVQSAMTIFEASATFFALVEDMEHDQKLSAHCPRYIFSSALVGVAFLARVMKGPFASYLDLDRGSKLYRVAIDFLKSCSIEKGDLPDRSSTFAEQMWLSNKVFKNPDGTPYIALRVRTRLSGSPLHDAIKWWRYEFVEERDEDRQGAHQGTVILMSIRDRFLADPRRVSSSTSLWRTCDVVFDQSKHGPTNRLLIRLGPVTQRSNVGRSWSGHRRLDSLWVHPVDGLMNMDSASATSNRTIG